MDTETRLTIPTVELEKQYLDMLADWSKTGEKLVPFVIKMDHQNFPLMIKRLQDYQNGIGVENFVAHSTYWLVNTNKKILGVVNIRHYLNESLLKKGGHIGYGIRPSERRKGYANIILQLAKDKARELSLDKVLLTCDKNNIGSVKTILKNGGILESEEMIEDTIIQRYWINLY
jgi:predicted acetyltransferase